MPLSPERRLAHDGSGMRKGLATAFVFACALITGWTAAEAPAAVSTTTGRPSTNTFTFDLRPEIAGAAREDRRDPPPACPRRCAAGRRRHCAGPRGSCPL